MMHPPGALIITDMASLARALADRRRILGLSQMALDDITGLADRHVAKLECGLKNYGPKSLGAVLAALGVVLKVENARMHSAAAHRISPEMSERYSMMGKKRAVKLNDINPQERRARARKAAKSRWAKARASAKSKKGKA